MATAMVASTATTSLRPRGVTLAAYVGVLIAAEVLVAYVDPATGAFALQGWGLAVHILLVFALTFHGALVHPRDPTFAYLLSALSLAPLVRIFSLAVPRAWGTAPEDTLPWLAAVSVPLLVAVVAVAYVQKLRPKDLGLGLRSWKALGVQTGIALTGIPLGLLEFFILRPRAWIVQLDLGLVLGGTLVIFLATGISEELIFRGIMLKRAVEGLGAAPGLLLVSTVFVSLHIFFGSPADLAFVFAVGLFYGVAVLRTGSLWGVILSHSLGNVVLYLVAPFM